MARQAKQGKIALVAMRSGFAGQPNLLEGEANRSSARLRWLAVAALQEFIALCISSASVHTL